MDAAMTTTSVPSSLRPKTQREMSSRNTTNAVVRTNARRVVARKPVDITERRSRSSWPR